ncbi:hypothetical protein NFI96_008625, partial [Prochilodus magdalenae]
QESIACPFQHALDHTASLQGTKYKSRLRHILGSLAETLIHNRDLENQINFEHSNSLKIRGEGPICTQRVCVCLYVCVCVSVFSVLKNWGVFEIHFVCISRLEGSGQPSKITPREQRRLIQEVTKDPTTTSNEVQASLASVKVKPKYSSQARVKSFIPNNDIQHDRESFHRLRFKFDLRYTPPDLFRSCQREQIWGGMVVQWVAASPHSKEGLDSVPDWGM